MTLEVDVPRKIPFNRRHRSVLEQSPKPRRKHGRDVDELARKGPVKWVASGREF